MNAKNTPIGRTVGRQLVAELPADQAPVEIIIDANNRLRRAEPGARVNKVTTLSVWAAASRNIEGSLFDPKKDREFLEASGLGLQIFGLRFGTDPMTPRAPRPLNADLLPTVATAVLDSRGLLADELPTAVHNIDFDRLQNDNDRLRFIRSFRTEVSLLDQSLAAIQTQVENRIAPVLDGIYERGKSVINSHLILRQRLESLITLSVGPAEEAADTRKENDELFQRGVAAGRAQYAAELAKADAAKADAAKADAADQPDPKPAAKNPRRRG